MDEAGLETADTWDRLLLSCWFTVVGSKLIKGLVCDGGISPSWDV